MNVEKAIEIKELFYYGGEMPSASDYRRADELSIEALKAIKDIRNSAHNPDWLPLSGETED